MRTLLAASLLLMAAAVSDGQTRPGNHLIDQKSPYLQLHAHDPVDWYPWGREAFEKARREDKPIFLSIGYSTCHWCHVMRDESFSNAEIAALLNRYFVSIKVDREERPDVDRIYMAYVLSTSGGGWPATLFLTPDLKPFFGATYMPPDDRNGQPGFRRVVTGLGELWVNQRDTVFDAARSGTQVIEAMSRADSRAGTRAGAAALDETYRSLRGTFDAVEGGFGGAPKFPRPVVLNFLLRYYARTKARPALDMTVATLRAMARGGIRDQIGGGFHRYATDGEWHVPHFEKMLYDQAQLAVSYTEAYQITKDAGLRDVARDILHYVARDMRSPEGGFFSAEDADSVRAGSRVEGAYYVWTASEIQEALGRPRAEVFAFHYDVRPGGNVPAAQDAQGELQGQNVLRARKTLAQTAAQFTMSQREVTATLDSARQTLRQVRSARPRPSRDDKILVAWNGMMISAFSRAAQVFGDARYLDVARGAAMLIESRLYRATAPNPKLLRRYRNGDADIDALLEDYAFLIQGLLDLYEASFDVKWAAWAMELQRRQDRVFWDAKGGGYFSTAADAPDLLARFKDDYDGAEPSANSVSAMNLLRVWQLTDRQDWRDKADAIFRALAGRPALTAAPQLAVALDFSLSKPKQIVIAGKPGDPDTRALLRLVHARFIPNKILLMADGGAGQKQLAHWLPSVSGMHPLNGKAAIYVCENYVCRLPTGDPRTAAALLDGTLPLSSQ